MHSFSCRTISYNFATFQRDTSSGTFYGIDNAPADRQGLPFCSTASDTAEATMLVTILSPFAILTVPWSHLCPSNVKNWQELFCGFENGVWMWHPTCNSGKILTENWIHIRNAFRLRKSHTSVIFVANKYYPFFEIKMSSFAFCYKIYNLFILFWPKKNLRGSTPVQVCSWMRSE